jgi:hypothetical protein
MNNQRNLIIRNINAKISSPQIRQEIWVKNAGKSFEIKCRTYWCSNMITPFSFYMGFIIPLNVRTSENIDKNNLIPICRSCSFGMSNKIKFSDWNKKHPPINQISEFSSLETIRPESVKVESVKVESVKVESVKVESVRPESVRLPILESIRPESIKSIRPESIKSIRPESVIPPILESVRPESIKTLRPESIKSLESIKKIETPKAEVKITLVKSPFQGKIDKPFVPKLSIIPDVMSYSEFSKFESKSKSSESKVSKLLNLFKFK